MAFHKKVLQHLTYELSKSEKCPQDGFTDTDMLLYTILMSKHFRKYPTPLELLSHPNFDEKLYYVRAIGLVYDGIVESILSYKTGLLNKIISGFNWDSLEPPTIELEFLEQIVSFLWNYYTAKNKVSGTLNLLVEPQDCAKNGDTHEEAGDVIVGVKLKPWSELRPILNYFNDVKSLSSLDTEVKTSKVFEILQIKSRFNYLALKVNSNEKCQELTLSTANLDEGDVFPRLLLVSKVFDDQLYQTCFA